MKFLKPILARVALAIAAMGLLSMGCSEASEAPATRAGVLVPSEPPPAAKVDGFGATLQDRLSEGDRVTRILRLAELFGSMRADQAREAVAVFDRKLNVIKTVEIELLFSAWARYDPQAALDHLEAWSTQWQRDAAFEATIYGWALRDPLAAREKVDEILDKRPLLRRLALTNLVTGWVFSGRPGVEAYVAGLSRQAFLPMGATALVGAQSRRLEATDLASWANEQLLPEADDHSEPEFFTRVLRRLAQRDPAVARAFADQHADAHVAGKYVRHVIEGSLARDPGPTLAWAEQFETDVREPPLRVAAASWLNDDFGGASNFIQETTLGAIHDPIVEEYGRALSRRGEWASSVAWVERIHDEQRRQTLLRNAVVVWLRKDPEAAELWLGESSFGDEDRTSMRELAARPVEPKRKARGVRAGRSGRPPRATADKKSE